MWVDGRTSAIIIQAAGPAFMLGEIAVHRVECVPQEYPNAMAKIHTKTQATQPAAAPRDHTNERRVYACRAVSPLCLHWCEMAATLGREDVRWPVVAELPDERSHDEVTPV